MNCDERERGGGGGGDSYGMIQKGKREGRGDG